MNKRTQIKTSAVKGIAWLTLSSLILKFIGLIYKVPISYLLGDEGMGYFNSAYSVYTLFYILCSSGIPKGISIIVSKYEAEQNENADSFYRSTLIMLGIFGFILSILFIMLAPLFTKILGSSKSLMCMYAVAPSVLFVCINGVARGYLSGKMRFSHIAISEVIIGVFKLVIGLLLAFVGIKLSLPIHAICALSILGITIGTLISTLYLLYVCKISTKRASVVFRKNDVANLIKISVPVTLASVGTGLMGVIDLFLIMRGLTSSGYSEGVANALYGNYSTLTLPMISLVSTLISPVTTAYAPVLTMLLSKNKMSDYMKTVSQTLSLVCFVSIPCFIIYMIYPSELLGIIFESGSAVLGFMMLSVISPSVLFMSWAATINNSIEVSGRVKIPVTSIVGGAVVKVVFTYILMKFTNLGILCAPCGTILSYATSFLISYYGFKKVIGRRINLIKPAFLPVCAGSFALLISTLISPLFYKMDEKRIKSIIILSVFSLIYLSVMLILSKNAREFLIKICKMNKKI